jgi:hypothetical protein
MILICDVSVTICDDLYVVNSNSNFNVSPKEFKFEFVQI